MLEASVEEQVIAKAKAAGFMYRKLAWVGRRGAMDRLFSREDTGPIFIEFKRPGERPSELQKLEHAEARAHGMKVFVVDNVPAGLRALGLE